MTITEKTWLILIFSSKEQVVLEVVLNTCTKLDTTICFRISSICTSE